jgi:D-beta-D-heptose 7-phosphate kinase/D-beta-D-heptose 1-phosphate adenosyltransferase
MRHILQSSGIPLSLAVVGDVALDRYVLGSVERVSREAPIPVVLERGARCNPGCAGNTAMNLKGLGCRVRIAGVVGRDVEATELGDTFVRCGIQYHLFPSRSCTILKTRIVAGRQQLLRVDRGVPESLDVQDRNTLIEWCRKSAEDGVQGWILSDYGYGVCDGAVCAGILQVVSSETPVIVDPRGPDWSKYKGAFVLTPNLQELSEAAGWKVPNEDSAVVKAADEVRRRFSLNNLLVTRSEEGMTLIGGEGYLHVKAEKREVFDVSGAGDTVTATLTALLAAGISLEEATNVANRAAGLVVQKAGTRPIEIDELAASYGAFGERRMQQRTVTWEEATLIVEDWKAQGLTVVVTNGCFDALHAGHLFTLREAKCQGDRLVVAVNSDRSVRELKGGARPLFPLEDRIAVLAALEMVDLVVAFDQATPESLYRMLRPHVLVKGEEYRGRFLPEAAWVDRVVFLPRLEGISTSLIEERLRGILGEAR